MTRQVEVGDEHDDAGSGVFGAEPDVVEASVVAQGHTSGLVDTVVADSPVGVAVSVGGPGFGSSRCRRPRELSGWGSERWGRWVL